MKDSVRKLWLFVCMAMLSACGSAKLLRSHCADILNKDLAKQPSVTARVIMTYKRILDLEKHFDDSAKSQHSLGSNVVASGDEEDVHEIKKSVKVLLEPIADFMKQVKESSSMIRTILVESLNIPFKGNLDTISLTSAKDSPSYILRYLNGDQDDTVVFMQSQVATEKDLQALCKELKTFIGDLKESLSKDAKESYKKFCEDIKKLQEEKQD